MLQPLMMNLDYAKGPVVSTGPITALRFIKDGGQRIEGQQDGRQRIDGISDGGQRLSFEIDGKPVN